MKMLLTLFVLLFSTSGFAEIKDKRIFNNFYNSCMEERPSDITLNEMKKYCSCAGNNVMEGFYYSRNFINRKRYISCK